MPEMTTDVLSDTVKMSKQSKQRIPLQKLYEDLANIGDMTMMAGAQCRERAQQVLSQSQNQPKLARCHRRAPSRSQPHPRH